ncbi:hypothetical protein LIER_41023 [Lithospermum erythrorhizon]|uniref:Uncharacterized protein n=1 Tax=Lithospermum erythrorhizon TaxID=34254 RepID=A0AAV3R8Y7_LITER
MSILSVTITFRIKTTILHDGNHMRIQKTFEAKMAPKLQICAPIDRSGRSILIQVIEASKQSSRLLCHLNNIDPESLHPHLLGNPSCRQEPELFPLKLRDKIRRWLFRYYNIPPAALLPRPTQDFGPVASFILHD